MLPLPITIGFGISTIIVCYIYNAFRRSIRPSKYMLIAQKMGFIGHNELKISMEKQHEALLQIFHLAGYFNLSNIWQDLNRIGRIENIDEIFEELSSVVRFSHADQPNPKKFNAKYMRKNLFKSDTLDLQDVLDLILYIGQHAYSREIGQERYELNSNEWIDTYANEYREAVQLLGLIDRENPSLNEYDGSWIAGASRAVLIQRIINFNNEIVLRKIQIHGEIFILAGEREIWADIDGIPPEAHEKLLEASQNNIDIDTISLLSSTDSGSTHIDEGKSYMMKLAEFYNIKLNPSQPFIQYKSKDECPSDRFPNRIYANYDIHETSKLTETLLSQDLWRTFSPNNPNKMYIIDTSSQEQHRPNTATTARDATERFVKHILAGDYGEKKIFVILLCTNNPYIERQTLATQRQVNQVLGKYNLIEKAYQIKIDGIGYSCKQQLTVVHSEVGALIAEKWRVAIVDLEKSLGIKSKRDKKNLFYQTRDKNIIVREQPTIKDNHLNNFIQNWFDFYLK